MLFVAIPGLAKLFAKRENLLVYVAGLRNNDRDLSISIAPCRRDPPDFDISASAPTRPTVYTRFIAAARSATV